MYRPSGRETKGEDMSNRIVMILIIVAIVVVVLGLIVEVLKRDVKAAFASFGLIVILIVGANAYYSFASVQSESAEQIVIENQIDAALDETEQKSDSLSESMKILLGLALAAIISLPIIIPNLRNILGETENESKK